MGISRDKWHKRRKTGARQYQIRMKRNHEIGRQPANTKLGERRVHTVRCRGGFLKYRAIKLDHGNYCWPGEAVTRKTRILGVVYNSTSNEMVRTNTLVKGSIVQIDATPFRNWYKRHYGIVVGKPKTSQKRTAKGGKDSKGKKVKVEAKTEKKETKETTEGAEKKAEGKKSTEKKTETKKPVEKKTETKKPVEKKKPAEKKTEAKKEETGKKTAKKEETKKTEKMAVEGEKKKGKGKPKVEKKNKLPKKSDKDKKRKAGATTRRKWRLRNKNRVLEQALAEQFDKGRLFAKISSRPGQIGAADGYILEGEELAFYVKKMNLKKKK